MKSTNEELEALQDIRKMMKESSKFLSLSGLSGVFAGLYALVGAAAVYYLLNSNVYDGSDYDPSNLAFKIIFISLAVLFASVLTAYIHSSRKATKNGQKLFDHTSKKVFWNMAFPLMAGGLFCLALLYHQCSFFICAAMLLFYGVSLLNIGKYMIPEIRVLGLLQMALGILASFYTVQGLLFWTIGFGLLHIVYGAIMWNKYDRPSSIAQRK